VNKSNFTRIKFADKGFKTRPKQTLAYRF